MHLNKVFKNAGILVSGDIIAAILGFFSFGILARSVGVNSLGIFTVIITYVTLIDKFVNFQSWQALIKYCDKIKSDKSRFDGLLIFGMFIDLISALVAFFISINLCLLISSFFEWDEEIIRLIQFFSIGILFNIEGTPTAIFRMADRFIIFSKKAIIVATVKLVLYTYGLYNSSGFEYYIYSTLAAQIIGNIYFILKAFKYSNLQPFVYLHKKNIKAIFNYYPNFFNFIWISNIQSSLKLLTSLVDVLLVSKYVGNSAVGLLQVAKQFSKIFSQISSPLYKSIYPELTSLWNLNKFKEFKSLFFKSIKIMTIFSVIVYILFVIIGKLVIVSYVGQEFVDSYELMLFYFVGVLIFASTFPFSPSFLAMNLPKIPLITTLLSSLLFITVFFFSYKDLGYLSIGVSFTTMTIFWLLQNSIIFYYKTRNL